MRKIILYILFAILFVIVGFFMSLYYAGYSHVNAKWLHAEHALNADDVINRFPSLKIAVKNEGKNITIEQQEYNELRNFLNDSRGHLSRYIMYNSRCYNIFLHPTQVKVWHIFKFPLNVSENDLKKFPYLKEAIETGESVKITSKEYDKIKNFLHDQRLIKLQSEYYVIGISMA